MRAHTFRPYSGAVVLFLLTLVLRPNAHSEESQISDFYPLEPAHTASPRDLLTSFIDSTNQLYQQIRQEIVDGAPRNQREIDHLQIRILRHLDLGEESELQRVLVGSEGALALKEVFDRLEIPDLESIPGKEELEDGELKELTRWDFPKTEIVIEKVADGPRKGEWLFSPETVTRAPEFYNMVKHLPYRDGASERFMDWYLNYPGSFVAPIVNRLPDSFRSRIGGRYALWQWIGLVLTASITLVLIMWIYRVGKKRSIAVREDHPVRYLLTLAFPVAAAILPILASKFVRYQVRITGALHEAIAFTAGMICLLAAMTVIMGLGSRVAEFIIASPKIKSRGLDAQLVRIVCKVLSIIAATIVFLEGGKYLGIPLSTLLASAGVGGIAFALAAQDSLKNLFGSMMILLDKPARIGERVVVKGYDGVVEEVGLRSTKLRLLNGNVAYIPNSDMAQSDIENIGRRKHIKRTTDIRLPIDTPHTKTGKALEIVRKALKDHEGMDEEFPPRVYFVDYVPDAQIIRMTYWYHPPNYWDFLAFGEQLNLHIAREFDEAEIRFALPSSETRFVGDNPEPIESRNGESNP